MPRPSRHQRICFAVLLIGVLLVPGCRSGGGLFRKRPPPPRADQLDTSRYSGVMPAPPIVSPPMQSDLPRPVQPAREPGPESADPRTDTWLPEWWSSTPVHEQGRVSVFAMGEDADLLRARQTALDSARDALKRELAGARLPDAPQIKADSLRLSDSRYRAFVRLTATPK